ncbi:hypothetical protein CDAR_582511 [Caerostris darwini]|uniref:Uncharacterized protein n=1 Tax=Caerostris darwini TaxID=1538125 RepID=A0AAV4RG78_9ARAC|nr:hypothetical protein CDAR_582511 [Caerostris darwini]
MTKWSGGQASLCVPEMKMLGSRPKPLTQLEWEMTSIKSHIPKAYSEHLKLPWLSILIRITTPSATNHRRGLGFSEPMEALHLSLIP